MSVAAIICTMNRPTELHEAIESLLRCDPAPAQIIVSDDSPESDRRSQELCGKFNSVTYQRGPRRGLGANRNAAIAAANCDWIHFIDDDVIVPADFYATAFRIARECEPAMILTGVERRYDQPSLDAFTLIEPPRGTFWGYMEHAGTGAPDCVVINAAMFPKRLFEQAAFDERMRYGSEEIDITRHAIRLGYAIRIEPTMYVEHYPSQENRGIYTQWAFASVVYSGLKYQIFFRRSVFSGLAFLCVAVPRMWINNIRVRGIKVFPNLLQQTGRGLKYFANYCRTRSERAPA